MEAINELQALQNALKSLNLDGYSVHQKQGKRPTYFVLDDKSVLITGSWDYDKVNHYIFGYAKGLQKAKTFEAEITRLKSLIYEFADKIKSV